MSTSTNQIEEDEDYLQNSFDASSDEDEHSTKQLPTHTTHPTSSPLNLAPLNSSSASAARDLSSRAISSSSSNPSSSTPITRRDNDGNSFMSRLNALSANRTGSTTSTLNVSRTHQPVVGTRGGSPVRTRLEKLSNRLALRAQQIAQEKRERESAILDHVQAMERKLDATTARMQDMERQHQTLQEELNEERKARVALESNYQEEITSMTHRMGRIKQDLEKNLEEQTTRSSSQMQAFLEDASNSVGVGKCFQRRCEQI